MPVKIVVVGAGHMGKIHFEKLAAMEGVQVSGVVDVDRERAGSLAERCGALCCEDYREVMEGADGVVIAASTGVHFEVGRSFLEKGAHVFMEKPIAATVEEARSLVSLAEEKHLVLQVGHLERFNPAFVKTANLVRKPLYIEARRISPFTGRSTDVSVVLDIMIHDIDLVLSLVRDRVKEVRAQGVPFVSDKLDSVNVRLEFENGCVANLTASRVAAGRERTMFVLEKDRQFSADLMEGRLIVSSPDGAGGMETAEYDGLKEDAVKLELTQFVAAARGETKPSVTGADGFNALLLADLIEQHIAARSPH